MPHLIQCLDILRDDVICIAGDTPRYTTTTQSPESNMGPIRQCSDEGKLERWAAKSSGFWRYSSATHDESSKAGRWDHCAEGSPWHDRVKKWTGKHEHESEEEASELTIEQYAYIFGEAPLSPSYIHENTPVMDSPGMTQAFGALLVATHRPATPKPDMPDELPETVQSPSVSTMVPYIPYQSFLQQTAPSIISAITSFSTSDSFVIESPTGLYWFRRYDVPERPEAAFLSRIPFSFFFQEQRPNLAQGSLTPATSKLPRFDFADYPVKFDEILGNGGEGVVVAATIRGKKYALKIFYMDKWRVNWKPRDFARHLAHHPFGHECIAFARIHHHHLDGAFTPKCYGWMRIVPHEVRTAFFPYRCGLLLRLGGYAIVKEYIPVTPKKEHVEAIMEGIQGLHDIGITVNDCRPCNYPGSKLVDLGHAFVDFEGDCYRKTAEDYLDSNMEDVLKQRWEC